MRTLLGEREQPSKLFPLTQHRSCLPTEARPVPLTRHGSSPFTEFQPFPPLLPFDPPLTRLAGEFLDRLGEMLTVV